MKKSKVIRNLTDCMVPHRMCRVVTKDDSNYYVNYCRLKVNEEFFLGAKEDDFQLNGFKICPVERVKKADVRDDKCLDINICEGVVDALHIPKVNISGWKQIFRSIKDMNKYVMIIVDDEKCYAERLYIGSIVRIKKHSILLRHFDADGIWQDEPVKIRFKDIQSVEFGSRYVDVFSKYIPKL